MNPVIEKVFRLCHWCGKEVQQDLIISARLVENPRTLQGLTIITRYCRCPKCKTETKG